MDDDVWSSTLLALLVALGWTVAATTLVVDAELAAQRAPARAPAAAAASQGASPAVATLPKVTVTGTRRADDALDEPLAPVAVRDR